MRPFLTVLRLLIHVVGAVLTTTLLYPFMNDSKRNDYVRKWSKKLLDICHVSVKVNNLQLLSDRALIVSNHISWLDIFLIYSVTHGHFIAKADMANWPMIGLLARKAGTLFLERSNVRQLKNTLETLVKKLKARERVIFFPEGTTSKQGAMLPFHPNLFEGAIHTGLPVQPFALKYVNRQGEYEEAVDSHGDITFGQSVASIIRQDYIRAELTILPAINAIGMHRKTLSVMARKTIISVLSANPAQENRDMPPETRHGLQDGRP